MLLIHCPYCEEDRPELEFRNAGEAHIARPGNIASVSDEEFEQFLFIRRNPKGLINERWRHMHGCGRFFNAYRDSVSDKFLATYRAGDPRPDLEKLQARAKKSEVSEAPSDKAQPKEDAPTEPLAAVPAPVQAQAAAKAKTPDKASSSAAKSSKSVQGDA